MKKLKTAGDTLAIDSEGVLFAKICGDAVSPAGGIIIRAKALYVPTLQSENLLPMGKLSNTSVTLVKTDTGTVATVNLVDVAGREASFTTTAATNTVLPLQLTPLSRAEADRYRNLFPEDLGEDAQYAVPRHAGSNVCATALLAALNASSTTAGTRANSSGDNALAEIERQAFERADRNAAATADAAQLEAPTTPEKWSWRGDIPYAGTTAFDRLAATKRAQAEKHSGVPAVRNHRGTPTKAKAGDAEYVAGPGQCQCPCCGLDMTKWSIDDRETHSDDCATEHDHEAWYQQRMSEPGAPSAQSESAKNARRLWLLDGWRRDERRAQRAERNDRDDRDDRPERNDRDDRDDRPERDDRDRRRNDEHANRDARARRRDELRERELAEAAAGTRRVLYVLNDVDLVRRIHVQHGHASPRRLAQAIHQGSIIIPDVEKHMQTPTGRRPPPLQNLVDAFSKHECETCAKNIFRASRRAARKMGKDIRPFDIVHMDTIPLHHKKPGDTKPMDPFLPDDPGGHLLLAVDEATRYTLTAFCADKTAQTVAAAFIELDNAIRHIMNAAREYNRNFADTMGYTQERIDDESKSIIRHVHSDNGTEFLYGIHPPGGPEGFGYGGREDRPHLERVPGGRRAPRATTSDTLRQYENGLAERRHQSLKAKAKTLMDDAGFGWKAYGHAYRYAAAIENLITTTVPIAGTTKTRQAVPFAEALGFPYDTGKRPVAPFGAIAFQREPRHRKRQFGTSRDVGVYLGPLRYPSRKLHVATLAAAGYAKYDVWSAETRMLTQDFLTRSAQNRADYLRDQLGDPLPLPQDPDEFEDLLPPLPGRRGAGAMPPPPALQASSGSEPDDATDDDDDEPNEMASRLRSIIEQRPRPRVIMTRSKQAAADAAAATLPTNFADAGDPQDSFQADNGDTSPATAMIARVTAGTSSHLFPLISRDLDPRRAFAIRPSTDGSQRRTIEQCTPDEVNAARAAEYRNLVENGV